VSTTSAQALGIACSNYDARERAYVVLESDPKEYGALDPNDDEVACPELPQGGFAPAFWTDEVPDGAKKVWFVVLGGDPHGMPGVAQHFRTLGMLVHPVRPCMPLCSIGKMARNLRHRFLRLPRSCPLASWCGLSKELAAIVRREI
jgi:hypothetical protein